MKLHAASIAESSENMLEARKSKWFQTIFSLYNRNLLRRKFHSFNISGLDFLLNRDERIPLIIYCNHSSWWDGLIAFEISRLAGLDSFVMMEEKHLRRLFLFRKLGAFSVVREKPRQAVESVNYAVDLIRGNFQRTLWIFPQGEILPNDSRPLKFYRGISKIVERAELCNLVSLAMRYEFLGEYKPEIYVRIAEPHKITDFESINSKDLTERLVRNMTQNLDHLRADVIERKTEDYRLVF